MLNKCELRQSSVEKEPAAIVEAVRKRTHYLLGRKFTVVTDQRSVTFMHSVKHLSKIKNEKVMRWRLLLSEFDFYIVYRPGQMNAAPDALSRVYCAGFHRNTLYEVHDALCHPGVTRLYHFVRSKNLPYSLNDVKKLVKSCRVCSAVKPQFYRPPLAQLVKATQPFERLSIDFKGPLPSNSSQRYLLTVVDEYSRFPFAFPCSNVNAQSVISRLTQLFVLFGMPAYIHSVGVLLFFRKSWSRCCMSAALLAAELPRTMRLATASVKDTMALFGLL